MGMAASQARYLQLAARKSNVEFEGQQINQQRTTLATESTEFYSLLTNLDVPVAPSSSEFTTTQYTFSDGAIDYTITDIESLVGDPDYNATVTYYYTTEQFTGIARTRSDLGVRNDAGTYWLTNGAGGGEAVNRTMLTQCTGTPEELIDVKQIAEDEACSENFLLDYEDDPTTLGHIYYYTDITGATYYYSQRDLGVMPPDGSAAILTSSYAADIEENIYQTNDAYIASTDSGRYSEITLEGYSQPFNLAYTTTVDEVAYNDAFNEYEYEMARYHQEVQSINAKISIVQKQDQQLELRLDELDTEQQALSTEMESVKKVIDKNIDSTFKTFND